MDFPQLKIKNEKKKKFEFLKYMLNKKKLSIYIAQRHCCKSEKPQGNLV